MKTANFRRIVTGHDAQGQAIVLEDAPPTRVIDSGDAMPFVYELWNTREMPVRVARQMQEPQEEATLPPPVNGTRARIIDFPPEAADLAEHAQAHFETMAGGASALLKEASPHPLMHRTESVDVAIVLEGEIVLIVDKGETVARQGDVIIQCGTNHSWANRTDRNCRMAFFMVKGKFEADIA